jgi:hypothetical protein
MRVLGGLCTVAKPSVLVLGVDKLFEKAFWLV